MATKKTTKKSTAKKPVAKRKPVAAKATVRKTTTKTAKSAPVASANPAFMQLAYALFAAAITYGFASWAIDSGSLWLYLASFVGLYLVVSYIKSFVKLQFFSK